MYFHVDNPFGTDATRPAGGDIVKHLTSANTRRPRRQLPPAPRLKDLAIKLITL